MFRRNISLSVLAMISLSFPLVLKTVRTLQSVLGIGNGLAKMCAGY